MLPGVHMATWTPEKPHVRCPIRRLANFCDVHRPADADMTSALQTHAERAATRHLAHLDPHVRFGADPPGYLEDWRDNLIEGVTPSDIEADFLKARGNELTDGPGDPARLRAAFSSFALALNTFGPFRHHPDRLTIDGVSGVAEARFEYPCADGLPGTSSHFDFWGITRGGVVAIESTFLELLDPKVAQFTAHYCRPFAGTETVAPIAGARWAAVYRALRDDPKTYRYLDAAQLMKHYLGLKHSYPDRRRVLIYVFWEPTNAGALSEYKDHRREIVDFARRVSGLETRFIALSYPDLWREWESHSTWPGMPEHLARLRARYSFAI